MKRSGLGDVRDPGGRAAEANAAPSGEGAGGEGGPALAVGSQPEAAAGSGPLPADVVEMEEVAGVPVARLGGEVDAAVCDRLGQQLIGAAAPGDGLVVDLSNLSYLDSSAVRTLFVVADHVAEGGGQLHVVVPRDSRLLRVLRIIQLDTLVDVHDSVKEACAALREASGADPKASEPAGPGAG